ncbi:MAG: ABC transporter ATP-binding protein [Paludibacter sp.]
MNIYELKEVVDVKKVEFMYRNQDKLLSNFNLNLSTGKIYGLLGKNGEGKTTLLKLLAGLLFPHYGEITINGLESKSRDPKILRDIFLLPDEVFDTNLNITLFKEVYASFYPNFSPSKFKSYLNKFTIDTNLSSISELSYGQKKKFFIAFGLATNAKLILLDEPTNGLDIPSKRQFRAMMAEAVDENCCIVLSTQHVLDLDDIVSNIIILDNHEIVFNQHVENINYKLLFKTSGYQEQNNNILYSEKTTDGLYHQISENRTGEKSKIDLELLFNAVISDHHRIKELFNS